MIKNLFPQGKYILECSCRWNSFLVLFFITSTALARLLTESFKFVTCLRFLQYFLRTKTETANTISSEIIFYH